MIKRRHFSIKSQNEPVSQDSSVLSALRIFIFALYSLRLRIKYWSMQQKITFSTEMMRPMKTQKYQEISSDMKSYLAYKPSIQKSGERLKDSENLPKKLKKDLIYFSMRSVKKKSLITIGITVSPLDFNMNY
jgi:hypothetical protein